jgi:hypothetical protein
VRRRRLRRARFHQQRPPRRLRGLLLRPRRRLLPAQPRSKASPADKPACPAAHRSRGVHRRRSTHPFLLRHRPLRR